MARSRRHSFLAWCAAELPFHFHDTFPPRIRRAPFNCQDSVSSRPIRTPLTFLARVLLGGVGVASLSPPWRTPPHAGSAACHRREEGFQGFGPQGERWRERRWFRRRSRQALLLFSSFLMCCFYPRHPAACMCEVQASAAGLSCTALDGTGITLSYLQRAASLCCVFEP